MKRRLIWSLGILVLIITASAITITAGVLAPPLPLALIPLWLAATILAAFRVPPRGRPYHA
jgi:hypothetical protein